MHVFKIVAGRLRVICAWIVLDFRFQWSRYCQVGQERDRKPPVPETETGGVPRAPFLKPRHPFLTLTTSLFQKSLSLFSSSGKRAGELSAVREIASDT